MSWPVRGQPESELHNVQGLNCGWNLFAAPSKVILTVVPDVCADDMDGAAELANPRSAIDIE